MSIFGGKKNESQDIASKELSGVAIRTMPEKFYAVKPPRKFSVVWLFLGVVVVAGVGLSALYLYRDNATPIPVSQTPPSQPDQTTPLAPAEPETPLATTPEPAFGLTPSLSVTTAETPAAGLAPTETALTPTVPALTPPAPAQPQTLVSTQDSDSDKLTDIEESLYNSDPKLPDTESDGHLDGNEVTGLFDPSRPSPASLESSGLVKVRQNDQWQYTIFYPAKWTARPIDSEQREVMFASPLGEFIEVLIQENLEKLPLADWYQKQSSGVAAGDLESFVTKRGIKALKSSDGLTYYLVPDGPDAGTAIYAVTYNAGTASAYNYLTTFRMMINSFAVTQIVNRTPQPQSPTPDTVSSPSEPATPTGSQPAQGNATP